MRGIYFFNQITLCFLAVAFTTSCHIQNSTNLQKDNTTESKGSEVNHPIIVKTQGAGPGNNIFCGFQDRAGNLWFGTTGEGVYRYDGELFTNYTTEDGLNSNAVWCIIEDKSGNILFGTSKGISRYDGQTFINFTQNTALSYLSISSMLEDKKGRLWVGDYKDGYLQSGIYLYDPSTEQADGEIFTHILSIDRIINDDGLELNRINAILEDADGNIWFAGQNREGVIRYDGKSLVQFRENVGLSDDAYRSMILDKKGNLWLGTQYHGVLRSVSTEDRKGEKLLPVGKANFINFTEKAGLSNSTIMSIIEDKKGNLWFCTDGEGVWRYDGTSFKNFTTEDGLLNNSVFSVVEDRKGNLWFGTRNTELYRYDGKSFTCFSE